MHAYRVKTEIKTPRLSKIQPSKSRLNFLSGEGQNFDGRLVNT